MSGLVSLYRAAIVSNAENGYCIIVRGSRISLIYCDIMLNNPLLAIIRQIIETQSAGISEYDLLVKAEKSELIPVDDIAPDLALFRKHFLLMNALYQLQANFVDEGRYLFISPLVIRLESFSGNDSGSVLSDNSAEFKLREYYLDWTNFEMTDEGDVDKLLTGFWQRFLSVDKRVAAMETLGLPIDAALSTVKQTYRRLASEHHPDKGGDVVRFREIREAYETVLYFLEATD